MNYQEGQMVPNPGMPPMGGYNGEMGYGNAPGPDAPEQQSHGREERGDRGGSGRHRDRKRSRDRERRKRSRSRSRGRR